MQSNSPDRLKYLRLLSRQYPNIQDVRTELIHQQAILNLPKGTEHFLSDIHGEYESFSHVMRNASGVIKSYIVEIFGTMMSESDMKSLATLVYYPKDKLRIIKKTEVNISSWYRLTIFRLIRLCKRASAKYTRAKVRKAMNPRFVHIMEELLHEDSGDASKQDYFNKLIETIIATKGADDYITELCGVIQRLAVDHLHIIGDIYDRGPAADKIMDELARHHSLDIQWGNHDIVWMGAAAGSAACILNVIRICARYTNLHTLEDGYGINLVPLVTYAMEHYAEGDLTPFKPVISELDSISDKEELLTAQIQKAAAILQFKAEAEIIRRHPEYRMEDRQLLHTLDQATHPLPTVDPQRPYDFTPEESDLLDKLIVSFQNSPRLRQHVGVLLSKGSMYTICNNNLLFHGCIPMNADGTLRQVELEGKACQGKALLDKIEQQVRQGWVGASDSAARQNGQDMMWYLWCGESSPLYGSDRMATFERYFNEDKATHTEIRDHYYSLRNTETACKAILADFGLNPETAHIINGHVPVKVVKGESPIKANGRLLVIDGGFAKAYQTSTGIAGYTLLYNSHGLILVSHEPFESAQKAIESEMDIHSSQFVIEYAESRVKVRETDVGTVLLDSIRDLTDLLEAYETGLVKEAL